MARLFNLDIGEDLRRAGAEFRSSNYLANLTQPTLGRGGAVPGRGRVP
jgi:hypothetical protein